MEKKQYNTPAWDIDELVDITTTDWWKEMEAKSTPGMSLHTYRTRDSLTLKALAGKVDEIPQHIYEMEKGKRGISKAMAKKFAVIFCTSPARFI